MNDKFAEECSREEGNKDGKERDDEYGEKER